MKQQYYKYLRDEDCLWFEFESVSNQKTVRKIVVYTPFQDNPDVFNLALMLFQMVHIVIRLLRTMKIWKKSWRLSLEQCSVSSRSTQPR